MLTAIAQLTGGFILLVWGADRLVAGASALARNLGVSPMIIGLTIIAFGTSAPELIVSGVAAYRGNPGLAVGNAIGSNVWNLLFVLGLAAVVAPAGLPVAPAALRFDLPVVTAVAIACLPVVTTGHVIARWEGAVFVAYFVAYATYLALDGTGHDLLPAYSAVMLEFVVPLTVLTLAVTLVRGLRARRRPRATR